MSDFPLLKTGAVAQYPLQRSLHFSTEVLRFVDGTEQRFRQGGTAFRRWAIQLDLLDEGEMATIEEFFRTEQGRTGNFAFTDPWDGRLYSSCSLENDAVDLDFLGTSGGSTALVIRENRD